MIHLLRALMSLFLLNSESLYLRASQSSLESSCSLIVILSMSIIRLVLLWNTRWIRFCPLLFTWKQINVKLRKEQHNYTISIYILRLLKVSTYIIGQPFLIFISSIPINIVAKSQHHITLPTSFLECYEAFPKLWTYIVDVAAHFPWTTEFSHHISIICKTTNINATYKFSLKILGLLINHLITHGANLSNVSLS